ncbi:STAS domain-containing protein [Kibdelosporangium lantanae]
MGISRRTADGATVITAEGDVDMRTAPTLRDAVTATVDQVASGPYVLDLTQVSFLDSAGLTALVVVHGYVEDRGDVLRIVVDANRPVIRPIELTGLDTALNLYHTVDEAVRAS